MSGPMMGDEAQPWPTYQQGQGQYTVNNIYDVSPAFLGDLGAYFTMNPFPVPIDQVAGYQNTARVLSDSGPLAGVQASIQVDNLPAQYFGLAIRYICRSDAAQLSARLNLQFNGDAGANYHVTIASRNGITWANVLTNHGLNAMSITQIPAGTVVPSNVAGSGLIEIPGYASGAFTTTVTCKGTVELDPTNDTQLFDILGAGHWNSAAPITSITIAPNAGNFVAGSRVVLYGF